MHENTNPRFSAIVRERSWREIMSGQRSILISAAVILGYVFLTQDLVGSGWILVFQLVGATILVVVAIILARSWDPLDIALLALIAIVLGMTIGLPLTLCGGVLLTWAAGAFLIFGSLALGIFLLIKSNPQ